MKQFLAILIMVLGLYFVLSGAVPNTGGVQPLEQAADEIVALLR